MAARHLRLLLTLLAARLLFVAHSSFHRQPRGWKRTLAGGSVESTESVQWGQNSRFQSVRTLRMLHNNNGTPSFSPILSLFLYALSYTVITLCSHLPKCYQCVTVWLDARRALFYQNTTQ